MAPEKNGVNNSKFHSMVTPLENITPIITQLIVISNGDVTECQELLVVGKELIVFLKDKSNEQEKLIKEALPISYLWPTMGKGLTYFFNDITGKQYRSNVSSPYVYVPKLFTIRYNETCIKVMQKLSPQ